MNLSRAAEVAREARASGRYSYRDDPRFGQWRDNDPSARRTVNRRGYMALAQVLLSNPLFWTPEPQLAPGSELTDWESVYPNQYPSEVRAGATPRAWTSVPGGWRAPGREQVTKEVTLERFGTSLDVIPLIPFVYSNLSFPQWNYYTPVSRDAGLVVLPPGGGTYVYWKWSHTVRVGQWTVKPVPAVAFSPARAPGTYTPNFVKNETGTDHRTDAYARALVKAMAYPKVLAFTKAEGKPAVPDKTGGYGKPTIPRGREGKHVHGLPLAAAAAFNAITESLDLWNAITDAAGFRYLYPRGGAGYWLNTRESDVRFWQQVDFMFNEGGWQNIDPWELVKNIAKNQAEDAAIGRLTQATQRNLNSAGWRRGFGFGLGPSI